MDSQSVKSRIPRWQLNKDILPIAPGKSPHKLLLIDLTSGMQVNSRDSGSIPSFDISSQGPWLLST